MHCLYSPFHIPTYFKRIYRGQKYHLCASVIHRGYGNTSGTFGALSVIFARVSMVVSMVYIHKLVQLSDSLSSLPRALIPLERTAEQEPYTNIKHAFYSDQNQWFSFIPTHWFKASSTHLSCHKNSFLNLSCKYIRGMSAPKSQGSADGPLSNSVHAGCWKAKGKVKYREHKLYWI